MSLHLCLTALSLLIMLVALTASFGLFLFVCRTAASCRSTHSHIDVQAMFFIHTSSSLERAGEKATVEFVVQAGDSKGPVFISICGVAKSRQE